MADELSRRDRQLIYNAFVLLKREVEAWQRQQMDERGGYSARDATEVWEQLWLSALQQLECEGRTREEMEAVFTPNYTYPLERVTSVKPLSMRGEDLERWLDDGGGP